MAELVIDVPTTKATMSELRPLLDAAFAEHFPGGLLQRRWEGEVLHVWGPGAKGTFVLENGRIVGRADLQPPASLMRPMIEKKIAAVLESVSVA